ncbi:LLM class F420-dependent oxidoreductase [Actinomadura sp. NBRC 104412]|uniref:TIGR03619 family F420-dependent LLM class oxidoreductase n=1 Tax=Actinomadura sp. NBRC 104412 TaxID=3032203 RepID=UPI0024A3C62A|nr:TIGR03619 family F420-dependent LLM class oxidoreductase [Actinomadura sp. NBRC 104412]GLZ09428.1 LLM class F420-dependent oxidoreductase [Actinomadura sp. NBRC 104412]
MDAKVRDATVQMGIGLPNGGSDVDPGELVRLAVGAEALGLDSVWVVDRWLRPHAPVAMPGVPVPVVMPAEYYRCVYDPIEVLSFIAARTEVIKLGTSAINVLLHPPVLLARRLATLDRLSGGRLVAGVTSGWMAEEFAVAGVPRDHMGDGFDDHLAAMRAVWGPDPVDHPGPRYAIPASDIGPKPCGSDGIPLIIGYTTPTGIRRAARIGDGLHPYRNDLDRLADELDQWREAVTAQGRDPSRLPVILRAEATPGDNGTGDGKAAFSGAVESWADDLARIESLGVDHVLLQFEPGLGVDATLRIMADLIGMSGP